jgi:arsenite transporter
MTDKAIKRLDIFERYLSLWVLLCMLVGIAIGKLLPGPINALSHFEFLSGSQVNVPIAILIWLMIYPMMLKIDFGGLKGVAKRPKGLLVTLFVNWLVKPFSMAFFAWFFINVIFSKSLGWIDPEAAKNYTAGLIILAAAPCTAMVFVWSYLTDGDSSYTLAQVAINDLIMIFAFAPIVAVLVGVSGVSIPVQVLLISVLVFIVIPLSAGWLSRTMLIKLRGTEWFEHSFLPAFKPVTILALLATLVLIFAFQAENILTNWTAVILLAIPILIQVYFNSALAYGLMRFFRVHHNIATPGALIGASNFFELAVAVAITLFGAKSPAGRSAGDAICVPHLRRQPVLVRRQRIERVEQCSQLDERGYGGHGENANHRRKRCWVVRRAPGTGAGFDRRASDGVSGRIP